MQSMMKKAASGAKAARKKVRTTAASGARAARKKVRTQVHGCRVWVVGGEGEGNLGDQGWWLGVCGLSLWSLLWSLPSSSSRHSASYLHKRSLDGQAVPSQVGPQDSAGSATVCRTGGLVDLTAWVL